LRKVFFLSAILFLYLFQGCKEDGEVVPEFNTSGLKFNDIIVEVNSSTVTGDSVLSSGTSRNLLGKLNDQVYGLSTSEFYSQLNMSSASLDISNDINFDSVVLYLAYDNFYGFEYTQEIRVYELTEDMSSETDYYSNATITSSVDILGSANLAITSSDTFGDSTFVLRIKLAKELADRIKEKGVFADKDAWLDFFKGIRVTTDETIIPSDAGDGSGAVVYFDLLNSDTKMSLYFQDPTSANTTSLDFIVESKSARFSHFEYQYSDFLNNVLEKEDENYNYIFAMSGSRAKITFKNLDSISQSLGSVAINKAQLVFPYEEAIPDKYTPPDRNVVIFKDDDGSLSLPKDFISGGTDYFGGKLDQVNKQYSFNLASTLHDIISNGKYDQELFLTVSGGSVTANRLTLNSGIHPTRKIYLILSFTKQQ